MKVPGSANNCSLLVHFVQQGFEEGMSIVGRCQTIQLCCITLGDWGCSAEGNSVETQAFSTSKAYGFVKPRTVVDVVSRYVCSVLRCW